MKRIYQFFLQKKDLYKKIQTLKVLWYFIKTKWWYSHFLRECGKGNVIMPFFLFTPKRIILRNNILINNNARIEAIEEYEGVLFNPLIIFHDNVQIEQNLHLTCATKIEIGAFTSIGANVTITDIHHPYDDISLPIEQQQIVTKDVFISEECKIYNNAVILPGTHIGKHCTIGANSVVNGQFPDYSVIVGVPARIVKRYSFKKQTWIKTDHNGKFIES
jgi:acetyltransferase-like isoleucine patch superfamily enzyme